MQYIIYIYYIYKYMYNVCFKSVQHSILCHLKTNDFVRDIHFFRHFSLETGLLPCFAIFFFTLMLWLLMYKIVNDFS